MINVVFPIYRRGKRWLEPGCYPLVRKVEDKYLIRTMEGLTLIRLNEGEEL